MNKPRSFPELLSGPDMAPLERVLQRSKHLSRLSARIKGILGPALSPHCQLANIRGTTLILAVTSTAWATRLRYQIPNLLQQLHGDERLGSISDIQIRITPENSPQKPVQPRRANMSADAAYCLKQCADSVEDERLRDALTRLATRQGSKN